MKTTMKPLILIAVSLMFGLALAGPKLEMEKSQHDFGDIDKGEKVSTVFNFKNTGDAPLEIKDVKTSCGCTSAKPKKAVYQPGESGEIPVTFNSERFSGKINKTITIETNEIDTNGAPAKTMVKITANVVADIVAKPVSLFFPRAKLGEVTSQNIVVSSNKLDKLEVTEVKAQPEFLKAEAIRKDDKTFEIKVTVDGNKFPEGKNRLTGFINFKTNSKTQGDMRSTVTVNIEKPLRVTPGSVFLFASQKGKTRQISLRVESSKGDSFEVSDIKSSLEYLDVELAENLGHEKRLKIVLKDDAPVGKFDGSITLNTSIEEQSTLRIPVRGSVVEPPPSK